MVLLGGLGGVLIYQELPEREWVPVGVGLVFVLGATCAGYTAVGYAIKPWRWDSWRVVQGEVIRSRKRGLLAHYRIYEAWICVIELSTLRRLDPAGEFQFVRGPGEIAMVIDARGRRFTGGIPFDDEPVPFHVVDHWHSRGLTVPHAVLDGRPPGPGRTDDRDLPRGPAAR